MSTTGCDVGSTPQSVIGNVNWNLNGSLGLLGITDPFNPTNSQTCTYAYAQAHTDG